MRRIWGDDKITPSLSTRVFCSVPNVYTVGDGARKDEDGYIWLMAESMMLSRFPGIVSAQRKSKALWSLIQRSLKLLL
jgi:sugar lactone lactonase YvrE